MITTKKIYHNADVTSLYQVIFNGYKEYKTLKILRVIKNMRINKKTYVSASCFPGLQKLILRLFTMSVAFVITFESLVSTLTQSKK